MALFPDSHPDFPAVVPTLHQFNPYAENGGTIAAIAGEDFVVIGADTRLSEKFNIFTRDQNRLFRLTDETVLACAGCWADALTLTRFLEDHVQSYQLEHNKTISTAAAAQLLSITLYKKRFFPFYTSNILVGLEPEGNGCIYSYDPIGHCEKSMYKAAGSSGNLMQPLLDSRIGLKNLKDVVPVPVTLEGAVSILKDTFTVAAERDIQTGDNMIFNIVTRDGIKEDVFSLRKD